jgi:hypothetical protein
MTAADFEVKYTILGERLCAALNLLYLYPEGSVLDFLYYELQRLCYEFQMMGAIIFLKINI